MNAGVYSQAYVQGRERTVRFLLSRGGSRDMAEDIAQMAWGRAWEQLHQLKSEGAIQPWVNTIALNLYRRGLQACKKFVKLRDMPVSEGPRAISVDLDRLISRCDATERHVLNQQRSGLSIHEIAEIEGVSHTAVRLRALRARRAARAFLRSPGESAA